MRLENWSAGTASISPYQAPESTEIVLRGIIYGDSRFSDGTLITTSVLVDMIDDKIITKSGSVYELGKVCPDYEKHHPNAKQRLLETLS